MEMETENDNDSKVANQKFNGAKNRYQSHLDDKIVAQSHKLNFPYGH